MAQLQEQEIINNAYYLTEQDSTAWETTDSEYLTARGLLNIGIGRWEDYDNTRWKELYKKLSSATDGDKTLTAGTYAYDCPADMKRPASYVRTASATSDISTFWVVITPAEMAKYANSDDRVCYFTGNLSAGFELNFNPNVTLTTGDTIAYEYYKQATLSSAITTKPELADPYFLSYFIAAHMSEGGIDIDFMDMAEARLENMRVVNMSALTSQASNVEFAPENDGGFGL